MKITQFTIFNQLTRSLQRNMTRLARYSDRLSSGKKISKPSDDVSIMKRSMDYKISIGEIDQLRRNIGDAESQIGFTEMIMSSVTDVLTRARELAIQGSNGSQTAQSRAALAQEVANLRDELLRLANSKFRNRYIFSGYLTNVASYDSSFNYKGDSGEIKVTVDRNATLAVNIPGDQVFEVSGVTFFESLDNLYDGLVNNNVSDIQSEITSIENALDKVADVRAELGAKLRYLDGQKASLDDRDVMLRTLLSETEDADIAETVSEIAKTELTLESLRASGARVLQQSLFDFLG
jgi:flagellar hook-associated protein 3 FlgL